VQVHRPGPTAAERSVDEGGTGSREARQTEGMVHQGRQKDTRPDRQPSQAIRGEMQGAILDDMV